MESELKDMNSNPPSSKEERPLLKSESDLAAAIEELDKKFAPYARTDLYGTMGLGPFPMTEKIKLAVAMVTLVPLRFLLSMSLLLLYYLICRLFTLFSAPYRGAEEEEEEGGVVVQEDYAHMRGWKRTVIVSCGRFLSRVLLFVFGFYWIHETRLDRDSLMDPNPKTTSAEISQKGDAATEEPERPGAIVSNHVSYLDILYHMSASFPSFVAKRSVGKLPLVGLISKCLGCVYVQREAKSPDFKGVSGTVNERVREAHRNKSAPTIMLFPEGTTTNGDYLLTFKTGAFLAGTPVLPVILKYPYERFSVAWDTISGARHILFLLCQFVNHLEVIRLPVYYPSQEEKDDPKLYASNVRRLMATEGNLILSDLGLGDKRIYHATLNGNLSQTRDFHQKEE
ncbi:PREDICTED: lysophospholipid acyltransferase LPEAT1 isoform X1 [Camelina sativa]|uniref:Acyl-CoA:lysophospholipid acyltransferase 1a.1 n=1 Tax=Camelina sativa TaxID=90675 RepID=A0A8G1GKU8_CAMSA|nr:PREDICTED: lysophospholipid acyltransferase LPEAT1 isoform X1 [Camelina sativa]QZA74852.1 acyl-CoA:lysophospholipid acyltransferase 1a.1 [Camelina sativa]